MKTSNIVVGNNLTARARVAIWYVEKGLHCIQTITDGGVFDINRVVHPKPNRRVLSSDVVQLYRKRNPNVRMGPLGNCGRITHRWQGNDCILSFQDGSSSLIGKDAQEWVDMAAWQHLQSIFPNVDVLHQDNTRIKNAKLIGDLKEAEYEDRSGQFEFEMKGFYDYGHFHATANYLIHNQNRPEIKFRSHSININKGQVALAKNSRSSRLEKSQYYQNDTPAVLFLRSLGEPGRVPRGQVFIRPLILKIKGYKHTKPLWDKTLLVPGDNHFNFGLIRELSLSQFTFKSIKQFKKIEKQYSKLRSEYGQSFEVFFVHQEQEEGSVPLIILDFQKMVQTMDRLIVDGCFDIRNELDKHRHLNRLPLAEHPGMPVLRLAKELYKKSLRGTVDQEEHQFTGITSDGLEIRVYDIDDSESF